MSKPNLDQIANLMSVELDGMSEMACSSIAREALKGLANANNPTDESEMRAAAKAGIRRYFSVWGDDMLDSMANAFMNAHNKL